MSTPEQPSTPPLTRKQLREIRTTGAVQIISPDAPAPTEDAPDASTVEPAPAAEPEARVAPLARAAEPAHVADAPIADANVDLDASPLTRRQARQQERIRTASVPVITADVLAAHAPADDQPAIDDEEPVEAVVIVESDAPTGSAEDAADEAGEPDASESPDEAAAPNDDPADTPVVNPDLGADLLAGEPVSAELPPSFDHLLARSSTGSVSTSNALIMSQTPAAAAIVAPISATGEVLITGTLNLPEGLGSTGHLPGTADGHEADAVLVDGELPAHSSPTPIAASAAISTVKSAGEIIQPPTPEKGGKLMLTLAITAGVLAVALIGVLIVAIFTGAFQ